MGVFSKINRFREAGQQANVINTERFGEPIRSLFTTTKVFTLHHHIDITDQYEEIAYQANSKVLSIHDKTDITDRAGMPVAHAIKMCDVFLFVSSEAFYNDGRRA